LDGDKTVAASQKDYESLHSLEIRGWKGNKLTKVKLTDSNVVEVDGIRFETVMPERVLTIPENLSSSYTPVQFGIQVTNLSLFPYRFLFFHLLPELIAASGQKIQRGYGRNATRYPKLSDFYWLQPGEHFTFFLNGKLCWYEAELTLSGRDKSGGIWTFHNLKPGKYKVWFLYENQKATKEIQRGEDKGAKVEYLWVGSVSTPFLEFCLINVLPSE